MRISFVHVSLVCLSLSLPDCQTSIINPPYDDAPEYKIDSSVPQGEVREFIMYSEDSKIYPGIVRVQPLTRDPSRNLKPRRRKHD